MTVGMLWSKYVSAHEGVCQPSHLRTQECAWRVHVSPVFGERRIASIVPSDVQAWVSSMSANGASASTVLRAFGVLKGIMEMAQRDRLIAHADCVEHIQLPHKPSGKEDRHYLTPEQLVALAGESGSHGLLVLVLGLCGLRWGEASGLRARDVDVERGVLHVRRTITKVGTRYVEGVPKSWERRDVPVPASLMRMCAARSPRSARGMWRGCRRAGRGVTCRCPRASCAVCRRPSPMILTRSCFARLMGMRCASSRRLRRGAGGRAPWSVRGSSA